uniref:Reverse transcriptase domain-containing protein n=1 Tax=Tanacetum cinerariifolium TaxID=118510 RepID=A0A6L2JW10_TANCI|nr:reverse transcriptase domain-containing protein [Tanacetum cinerariifolium]
MNTHSSGQEPTSPYLEPERFIHRTKKKKKKRNPFIPLEDRISKVKYPPFENPFEAEVVYNPFLDLPFPMANDQPMWGNNRAVVPTLEATIIANDLGDNFPVKDAIKVKLFLSSLARDAKVWFNELSLGVITTWEEMRQAFVSRFFPPTFDPPVNPNAKTTIIDNDSEDEADEAEKEVEPSSFKQTKSDPPPLKAYKLKIRYPQRLRKEKMEERYANNSVECLAVANLGASINLMPYFLYTSLSENTLKPTRMSIRLANHTYQYPIGVAENMLIQLRKFVFFMDFIILQMEEDDKVPLILGRPFLHATDAIIRVKNEELNLGAEEDRITLLIDKVMQHSYSNDGTCFRMDVIDEVTREELITLLDDSEPFLNTS